MPTASLDFISDDQQAGFRLHRFEVLNWGTFHQQVWQIEPAGHNALLTGDIGSGKSTLVDALTTLLVPRPANQIVYNKAAGAESQERTLGSYVRGEYKSEKQEESLTARAVSLRDHSSYSVVLAHFFNEGYQQNVTLAQVFWFREQGSRPERMFVVAETNLSIQQDFSDFGEEIRHLRKKLRNKPGLLVCDGLTQYATQLRRHLGIRGEKALDLFYQTVSLKSVGNLTQFVRDHMLEAGSYRNEVDKLCTSFDNLNQAHTAVVKARQQIEQLTPLVTEGKRHLEINLEVQEYRQGRDLLGIWRADLQQHLLVEKLHTLATKKTSLNQRISRLAEELATLKSREASLRQSFEDAGGGRLNQIARDLQQLEDELTRRKLFRQKYTQLCNTLGLPESTSEEQFQHNRQQAETSREDIETQQGEWQNTAMDLEFEVRQLQLKERELSLEIDSLMQRKSNIPQRMIQIRAALCEELGIDETDLPFIGELLQSREDAGVWEGAIERLLHNFALSMAVDNVYYDDLSRYVNRTHLNGRLVYYRVTRISKSRATPVLLANNLLRKLAIKPDSFCYEWLESQIADRFDYACCDDLDEFRRHKRAVTQTGQIKGGNERHEKDDRHQLNDRSRFVLGWSNEAKLKTLKNQLQTLQNQGRELFDQKNNAQTEIKKLSDARDHCRDLLNITHYRDIHWQEIAARMDSLHREQQSLQASSDTLRTLQQELDKALVVIAHKEQQQQGLNQQVGSLNTEITQSEQALQEAQELLQSNDVSEFESWLTKINNWHQELDPQAPTLRNLNNREQELRRHLQSRIDNQQRHLRLVEQRLFQQMGDYNHQYPVETRETDVSLEALSDYERMLIELIDDGLPGFEQRFHQELKEKTIQSLVHFQNRLTRACDEIRRRISEINTTLREIEYNDNRYIILLVEDKLDAEIRQFRQDLKSCLADTFAEDLYGEERFLQVQAIIERLRGREGLSEADKRWTNKVTDVRNWFEFSASERWMSDDTEFEFYSGSSGKSGGQKEKLAYTVLASALAYQFGLEWGVTQSRSFRFVVIDEAFGRGSDDSARYALELFRKLNLQLLIVTPLQKIHVIEDYIRHVHFVHNQGGNNSMLRNMTIEQYRQEKNQRDQAQLKQLTAKL